MAVLARSGDALRTAGGMDDEDMEGVASDCHAIGVKDVARGAHVFRLGDCDGTAAEEPEGQRRIEERYIDAALVGRMGDDIFVTGLAEQRAAREGGHH